MTIRQAILISFLALSTALGSGQAFAEGVGTKTVRQANSKLSKMFLAEKTASEAEMLAKARKQLGGFLNVEELGKRALSEHWTSLSKAKQTEFTTLLRQLIETNYVKGMKANVKYKVSYLGEKPQGEFLLVQTVVKSKRKGRPLKIEIDYLLSKSGDTWSTFDIITDGIGLVENYRAMFNKIIGKSGFDALLEKMRKKLAAG